MAISSDWCAFMYVSVTISGFTVNLKVLDPNCTILCLFVVFYFWVSLSTKWVQFTALFCTDTCSGCPALGLLSWLQLGRFWQGSLCLTQQSLKFPKSSSLKCTVPLPESLAIFVVLQCCWLNANNMLLPFSIKTTLYSLLIKAKSVAQILDTLDVW